MNRFVAIDVSLGDNPKVRRFARELFGSNKLALAATAGCLTMLLGHCKISAPSGDISEVDDSLLEEWAHWPGKPGVFAQAFRARFAADGKLNDWEDWNGNLIRQQEANRKKAQEWRDKQAAYQFANGNGNGTRTSTRTVRNPVPERFANGSRTANQPTIPTNQPPHPKTQPQKKNLAEGSEKSPSADTTWLTEPSQVWERRFGAGSFDFPKAGKLFSRMYRAGIPPGEIATRLSNYLDVRYGDKFLSLKEFAEKHGEFAGALTDEFGQPTELGKRVNAGLMRRSA